MSREEKGTVLVVDDNAQSLGVAGDVLEQAGYRVLLADGGEQCIVLARAEPEKCGC